MYNHRNNSALEIMEHTLMLQKDDISYGERGSQSTIEPYGQVKEIVIGDSTTEQWWNYDQ